MYYHFNTLRKGHFINTFTRHKDFKNMFSTEVAHFYILVTEQKYLYKYVITFDCITVTLTVTDNTKSRQRQSLIYVFHSLFAILSITTGYETSF